MRIRDDDELRASRGPAATPSRLELLRASDSPRSHGEVADRLASQAWDRATIYRNRDHVWRFEALSGGAHTPTQHPHFVCTECADRAGS